MSSSRKRYVLDDLQATFEFVRQEHGELDALIAVVSMFSANRAGRIEHRPARHILDATCQHFCIGIHELLGRTRPRRLARARQVAAWLLRANGYSTREAGRTLLRTAPAMVWAAAAVEASDELMADATAIAGALKQQLGRPSRRLPVIFSAKEAIG